ncbi:MAG: cysteine--tRNA ligase [Ardenticatenales bacterium]
MALQIFNTLTGRKEPFETIEPGIVKMYVCGVTVYASAHVGHAMSYLVFDTIRRYLEHLGYTVRHVQNFTDVDDKIIARANSEGVSAFEIADRYAREFTIEIDRLGLLAANIYPRVSSEMPAIVAMIQDLVAGEHAYAPGNGDVYFDVGSFPTYGQLSRRNLAEARPTEAEASFKHTPHDFALWKAAKLGEPAWASPWGPGRPGWHIECSAMARAHLGDSIDLHGGGDDLKFPHHENEIAQSEACCGVTFSRYWVHNGLVQVGDEKMSKSLGNIVSIRSFLNAHEPEALRLFVQSGHYRNPTTLTDEAIEAAEKGLARLRGALRPAHPSAEATAHDVVPLASAAMTAQAEFDAAMDDDFGTPGAVAALFNFVTEINRAREAGVGPNALEAAQATLIRLAGILGYDLPAGHAASAAGGGAEVGPFVDLVLELRTEARAARDFATSDRLRDALAERGVVIEDGPSGTTWRLT